jgi:tetratricopeptide (TPR) repeat protein
MAGMNNMRTAVAMILALGLASCASTQAQQEREKEKDPQYQYDKAVVAYRYGLPERAVEFIDAALALDPAHYDSLNLLGAIRFQAGDYPGAADALEKCLAIKPDLVDALNRLGSTRQAMKDDARAEEAFLRSYAVDGNAFAAFSLARIYLAQKKLPEALGAIDKAAAKSPRESGVHNLRGVILNQMERYEEAVRSLETAVALAPKDVNAGVNLGIALMNRGEKVRAREIFEKVYPEIKDAGLKATVAEYIKAVGGTVK